MSELGRTFNAVRGISLDTRAPIGTRVRTAATETGGTQEYKWRVISYNDLKTNLIIRVAWQKKPLMRKAYEEHVIAQVGRIDADKDGHRTVTFRITNAGTTTQRVGSTFTVTTEEDIKKRFVYHEREETQAKK